MRTPGHAPRTARLGWANGGVPGFSGRTTDRQPIHVPTRRPNPVDTVDLRPRLGLSSAAYATRHASQLKSDCHSMSSPGRCTPQPSAASEFLLAECEVDRRMGVKASRGKQGQVEILLAHQQFDLGASGDDALCAAGY
jgi:hypothetical protein